MANFYGIPGTRDALLRVWQEHCRADVDGGSAEVVQLRNTGWLWQAEVTERLVYRDGRWLIYLVYYDPREPMRMFVRHIGFAINYANALTLARRLRTEKAAAGPPPHKQDWPLALTSWN